jgi:hypothetical protein
MNPDVSRMQCLILALVQRLFLRVEIDCTGTFGSLWCFVTSVRTAAVAAILYG